MTNLGVVQLKLQVWGRSTLYKFAVIAEMLSPMLLGVDFLMEKEAFIDFNLGIMTLRME